MRLPVPTAQLVAEEDRRELGRRVHVGEVVRGLDLALLRRLVEDHLPPKLSILVFAAGEVVHDGRKVDDPATSHLLEQLLGQHEMTQEVGAEHQIEVTCCPPRGIDAGIVDEHVDVATTVLFLDTVRECFGGIEIRQIQNRIQDDGLATGCGLGVDGVHRPDGLVLGSARQHHLPAVIHNQRSCRFVSEASVAACHNGELGTILCRACWQCADDVATLEDCVDPDV
mmetsp:Transcript_21586/g.60093  ORF Transcript_21586/g.60093 Transcript_21586/m.60093 type:complete len:226 (+) Transcript_21586:630-1307(+)